MFLTYDKKSFQIRADNGLILCVKYVPREIQTAVLNGNLVVVTTKDGTWVYKQVGTSPVFNFYKQY